MSNHYLLMFETPEPNLVAGMKWLQNTVTRRFNVRHRAWGRVFGDRYKAVLVEGGERFPPRLSLPQYFQRAASSTGSGLPAITVASLAQLEAERRNRQRYSID